MRNLIIKAGPCAPGMGGPSLVPALAESGGYDRIFFITREAPDTGLVERLGERLRVVLSERSSWDSVSAIREVLGDMPDGELDLLVDHWPEDALAAWQLWFTEEQRPARLLRCPLAAFHRGGMAAVRVSRFDPAPEAADQVREPAVAYRAGSKLEAAVAALGMVGEDPVFQALLSAASQLAPHPVPVLIQGETGTGKELVARLVHALSGRPAKAFVAVNCGALPDALAESILFGHCKGAFTGAMADQRGKFEHADGGTLFLDELGELPSSLQVKLLRVLQEGVVEPVGAAEGRKVEVRIIGATHRDLKAMVAEGDFREDLYYRLALGPLQVPPLRARRSDIPRIAGQIVKRSYPGRGLSPEALALLSEQSWPGNVRDLENAIGRSMIWCEKETLEPDDLMFDAPLPAPGDRLPDPHDGFSLDDYLADIRRKLIFSALEQCGHNKSAAARVLGVSPQAVSKFLKSVE